MYVLVSTVFFVELFHKLQNILSFLQPDIGVILFIFSFLFYLSMEFLKNGHLVVEMASQIPKILNKKAL